MGQTRVDLQHLLEDLRDAYPDALEETILSEVVANALDSGASNVHILSDPTERTVVVVDDGCGMSRREVARYHDLKKTAADAYDFAEERLNVLGYQLLADSKVDAAVAILRLNAEAYPESANAHDSLGEALMAAGSDPVTATQKSQAMLFGIVQRQATMLSFLDLMRIFSGLVILILPLIWLARPPRSGKRGPAAVH